MERPLSSTPFRESIISSDHFNLFLNVFASFSLTSVVFLNLLGRECDEVNST